jgi:ATP-dependent RNA helicase RhlB
MKTVIVAETVADLPAAAEAMAADGAPKKRRRRGGRGRGPREGAENGSGNGNATAQGERPKSSAAPRQTAEGQSNPNRRPSRQVAANRPSVSAPAPAASGGQEKVGFFRRIGRLFGGS